MRYGLELAVQGGMTPGQAIEAVTRVAAEACGISHLVGTLEPGKEADLFIVRGDPLADIRRVGDVAAVYKAGQLIALTPMNSLLPGATSAGSASN
jgi:imidazolonepropionase-like amidohydrolase